MSTFSNIMCCVNLSENPNDVVQYAKDLARDNDAKLIMVHVSVDIDSVMGRVDAARDIIESKVEEARKINREGFASYVAEQLGEFNPTIVFAEGQTDEEVLRAIDEYCADLVVIGSLSTKGFLGGLFNKKSENIIGRTRIPVLVVPNDLSLECTPHFS